MHTLTFGICPWITRSVRIILTALESREVGGRDLGRCLLRVETTDLLPVQLRSLRLSPPHFSTALTPLFLQLVHVLRHREEPDSPKGTHVLHEPAGQPRDSRRI